jgi:hypothetical protein
MKKIQLILFVTLLRHAVVNAQAPISGMGYYYQGSGSSGCIWYHPSGNSTTMMGGWFILPSGSEGLAIGPNLGFSAPNPTYWTVKNGTYYYFSGNGFVNTGHSAGGSFFTNPGASRNFIYNVNISGQVSKYDGTGNATVIATFTNHTSSDIVTDIVGDQNDNFYLAKYSSPQGVFVYNSSAALTCSYVANNIPYGSGLAISGGMVNVLGSKLYVGTVSNNTVSFSEGGNWGCSPSDLANSPADTYLAPLITASPSSTIPCAAGTIVLSSGDLSGMNSYTWAGPGIMGSVNSQSVVVGQPGVYSRTMVDCGGIASTSTLQVYSGTNQPLVISGSSPYRCAGGPAVLLTVGGLGNYSWTPASSLSSASGSVVNASPSIPTQYTVNAVMNGCIGSTVISIGLVTPLNVTAGALKTSLCAGENTTLTVTGSLSFTWVPGNMLGQFTIVSPAQSTTYSASGYDSNGCLTTGTTAITVIPYPTLMTIPSKNDICAGEQISIYSTGAMAYQYDPGGFTGTNINVSPLVNTVYTVTGSNSNCAVTQTMGITVHPVPSLISTISQLTVCSGEPVNITSSGADSYFCVPASLSGSLITVYPSVSTSYTITGHNQFCSATKVFAVTALPKPALQISSSSPVICAGEDATLTVSGGQSYLWENQASSTERVIQPQSTTGFTVTGFSGNGCSRAISIVQQVSECTGIAGHGTKEGMILFPNPASESCMLRTPSVEPASSIFIYNSVGSLIDIAQVTGTETAIDLRHYASGLYTVVFASQGRLQKLMLSVQ